LTARIVTRGSGTPLVLIPGVQGRWEYMREAVDALARSFRVITFALAGERASGLPFDAALGLDNFDAQVLRALDEAGIERAVICGVSFGGVVAARFAARHPERIRALVLVSTPGPIWNLKPRHQLYARAPWVFGALFAVEAPLRLRDELAVALPRPWAQVRFVLKVLRAFMRAPVSLGQMGRRARLVSTLDLADECRRITAPTLVVTGEAGLDHVVPMEGSSQYVRLIAGARGVVLERTGHQGVITQPETFAAVVRRFIDGKRHAAA
jgi:pimeloyl-ACP methyl ester carboxylesterase